MLYFTIKQDATGELGGTMERFVATTITRLIMTPFVFLLGGLHAVYAFWSKPKMDKIIKENPIP